MGFTKIVSKIYKIYLLRYLLLSKKQLSEISAANGSSHVIAFCQYIGSFFCTIQIIMSIITYVWLFNLVSIQRVLTCLKILFSLDEMLKVKLGEKEKNKSHLFKRWFEYFYQFLQGVSTCLLTKVRKLSIWWSATHNSLVLNTEEVFHIKNDCWNIHNYQLLRNHFIWIKNMSHLIYQMLSAVILFFRSMYWKVIKTTSVSLWPCIDIKNNTNPLSTTI